MTNKVVLRATSRPLEAANRIMRLLSLFVDREQGAGIRVGQAAQALEVDKSTASRLLATLKDGGFLVLDGEKGTYHVGLRAYALGSRFSGAALAAAVQDVIRGLSDQTSSTAQFGVLDGSQIVYLAVHEAEPRLRLVARPGDRQYLHASAMGKAILSVMPSHEQQAAISAMLCPDGLLPTVGPATLREPGALANNVRDAAGRGYSVTSDESSRGVIGIGAHVATINGLSYALSIAFVPNAHGDHDVTDIAKSVVQAAQLARQRLLPDMPVPQVRPAR